MTRADENVLERRKVAALERIADALEMIGEPMPVQKPQMFTGQAAPTPKLQEPAAAPPATVVEEDTDEVEPMNDES